MSHLLQQLHILPYLFVVFGTRMTKLEIDNNHSLSVAHHTVGATF